MRAVYRRSFQILGVRLLRGFGYRGGRPAAAALLLVLLVLAADIGFAIWLRSVVPPSAAGFLVAAAADVVFFLAGPVLLLTESIRDRGARIHLVLAALPLTLREIAVVTWLPGFSLAVVLLTLLAVPAFAVFSGLGLPTGAAAATVAAALLAGWGFAALVIAACRRLLRGGKWATVQFPVMLLFWVMVCAVQTWQAGRIMQTGTTTAVSWLLVLPRLTHELSTGGRPHALTTGWAVVLAAGAVALVPLSLRAVAGSRLRRVLWQWRATWPAALTLAELTRFVRAGTIMANLVAAEVISVAVAVVLVRVPEQFRPQVAPFLALAVVNLNALPLLLIRGQTRARWPVPLRLGVSPSRWVRAQLSAGFSLYVVMSVPPLVVMLALHVPASGLLTAALPAGALAFGLAVAIGWLLPASPDNPLGQFGGTLILFVVFAIVCAVAVSGLRAALGLALAGVPVLVEHRQWIKTPGPDGFWRLRP